MSEVRNLRRPRSDQASRETLQSNEGSYPPPCAFLLEQLGVSAPDVRGHGTASVSRRFLRALIGEFVARARFDHDWYAETYPDVEGARLAGDIQSLHEHFKRSGYFEGRLPAELPSPRSIESRDPLELERSLSRSRPLFLITGLALPGQRPMLELPRFLACDECEILLWIDDDLGGMEVLQDMIANVRTDVDKNASTGKEFGTYG